MINGVNDLLSNTYSEYPTLSVPYSTHLTNYDPIHAMLVKKHQQSISPPEKIIIDNTDDVKSLEEFCKKYGIMAMNFGNLPSKAVLNMLKKKMGIIETPQPSKKIILND